MPDAVDDMDMVQGSDHIIEDGLALFVDFAFRQRSQAVEEHLICPPFVLGKHVGRAKVDHEITSIKAIWEG
ncbi:hypothetical protein D3C86_2040450 [compost metagenome]